MSIKKMILVSVLIFLAVVIFGAIMVVAKPNLNPNKFRQACGQLIFSLWVLQWAIWFLMKRKKEKL